MIDKANVGGTVHDINDTGARGMISPDVFSTAAAYEAGEYCIYNNTLYKFTEAKSAGAWDDSKASATDIASELSALNSSLEMNTENITDGVIVYYNACTVTIKFAMASKAYTPGTWNTIATIPENLRPVSELIFATVYKGNIIKINNGLPILRRDTAQTRLRAVFL